MELLTNGLLIAATLFAGGYCWVLSGRVRALQNLDKGLGGSIVQLTRQIELARQTLDESRVGSEETRRALTDLVERADTSAHQLRLLIASTREQPRKPQPRPETPVPAQAAAPEPFTQTTWADTQPAPSAPEEDIVAEDTAPRNDAPAEEPVTSIHPPDVPKPRSLPPMSAPLRLFTNENPPVRNGDEEKDILAALQSIAGGNS